MAERVVIEIDTNDKDLDSTIEKLEKLGKVDKKNAESFKKTSKSNKKAIKSTQSGVGKLSKGFAMLGGAIAGAFAIQQVVSAAAKTIMEFEKSLASLSAITGAVGKDLDFLKDKAIELGAASGLGAAETAKAFELIGSAKPELLKSGAALASVTEQAILLSQASGLDLTSAANAVTTALNQFGLGAEEAGRSVNVLAAGAKEGASAIPATAEALTNFGAVASGANITLEQSVGLIQVLAEKQMTASVAGNNLKNIILKLQTAGKGFSTGQFVMNEALVQAKSEFDAIIDPAEKVRQQTKLFGTESITAANILLDNIDAFNGYTTAITGTNVASEQAAKNQDTIAFKTQQLTATWDALVLSIESGDGALGSFAKGALEAVTALLKMGAGLDKVKDRTVDLLSTNTDFLTQGDDLVATFEELSSKESLNADEKRDLATVTQDLALQFGASVVSINKETGAIEVNIQAIKNEIIARTLLQGEQAQQLLAEQAAAEVRIRTLKGKIALKESLEAEGKTILSLVGKLESHQSASDIAIKTQGDLTTEKLQYIKALEEGTNAVGFLAIAEEQLAEIEAELLRSGIDLDALAKSSASKAAAAAAATTADNKGKTKTIGLLGKLTKQIKDLRAEQNKTNDAERVLAIELEVKAIEKKIRALKGVKEAMSDEEKAAAKAAKAAEKAADKANKKKEKDDAKDLKDAADIAKEKKDRDINNAGIVAHASVEIFANMQQRETDLALAGLDARLTAGTISEEQFAAERKKILTKQAKQEKTLALFDIAIGTAVAIAQALPNAPLAIAAGIAGAAQAAVVASTPIPQMRKGGTPLDAAKAQGMLRGASHERGGIMIEAEGNEYLMPVAQSMKYRKELDDMRMGVFNTRTPKVGLISDLLEAFEPMDDQNIVNELKRSRNVSKRQLVALTKMAKGKHVNQRNQWA